VKGDLRALNWELELWGKKPEVVEAIYLRALNASFSRGFFYLKEL
jgi:hypothetical protein